MTPLHVGFNSVEPSGVQCFLMLTQGVPCYEPIPSQMLAEINIICVVLVVLDDFPFNVKDGIPQFPKSGN